MSFQIDELFNIKEYNDSQRESFNGFKILDAKMKNSENTIYVRIALDKPISSDLYNDLRTYMEDKLDKDIKLYVKAFDSTFSNSLFDEYLREYSKETGLFYNCVSHQVSDGFRLSYIDEGKMHKDLEALEDLKLYFFNRGYRADISLIYKKKEESFIVEEKESLPIPERHNSNQNGAKPNDNVFEKKKTYYQSKTKEYKEVIIDDLVDNINNVKFKGEIFKVDVRTTRTGMTIQTLFVKDNTNALVVKVMDGKRFSKKDLEKNQPGTYCEFYGTYHYDNYQNDYLFEPDNIVYLEKPKVLFDDSLNKRVELHTHTKFSEMDGVSNPSDIVTAAFDMGHRGVAITDHLCLQGFHSAQTEYLNIKKKNKDNPDFDFKVLYGCEMNMVEPFLNIVYNSNSGLLSEQEYVVFDLETTGLSSRHDYVIEFGAVLMSKGQIVGVKDFFIKPPVELSKQTKELTHITDENVQTARTFAECKDEILEFIKGRVLVAHNASFDYGFLNEELARLGLSKLVNPVVDTLDLSRSMFKSKKAFRLGHIAKEYGVEYDEDVAHRANYDADVLAQIFNLMLKDLAKNGVYTLDDLRDYQGENAFDKKRSFHTTVLCKNIDGLHDLFKLISISHTKSIAVYGKSAKTDDSEGAGVAEPRIFKETLNDYRKNLLIGSACFNGEVFEIASTRNKEALSEAISFYDYIEIQPIENYRPLFQDKESFSQERLFVYLRDIIDEAERQGKIIVATGDVHFVKEEEKILRDVYIRTQGIGGVRHPLYVYNKEKRAKQVTPDQRFLNTEEMLDAFKWLDNEEKAYEYVVTNTNKILDLCDNYLPFSNKLYPPHIPDALSTARRCRIDEMPFVGRNEVISADDYLRQLVYYTAHSLYGEKLDDFIEKRIERELNAIIGNGYGVIYYVCHLMVKRSNSDGYIVGSRGSVGSSLVATFSGITEVNPLPSHYICPKCHHLEWRKDAASGYDLPDKKCPECGETMRCDGQNIPFETFLGFDGDKIPDIDLNFSGEYQDKAHLFTREIFGENNVFRAGTIGTVAEKTAFGYVAGYFEDHGIVNISRAQKERLATGCVDVKRTTGQHAGGIVVLPDDMQIEDITPIQYPANYTDAAWKTTHFEYHDFSDNLLKFDILGHVDPTAMRLFEKISGIDVKTIPMNDPKVLSLFSSSEALDIINPNYHEETGACGLPEFGTLNTRNTIEETRPHVFSELVQISGLSHGTDVWRGNAEELIKQGIPLKDVIGCRDDIMSTLIGYGLEPKDSFSIMEHVRKGKGLTDDEAKLMMDHNVPKWYIDSANKIKYMFPKAHAVAYCIMAVRVAWFKVYYPAYYYISFFSLRCDAFDIEEMIKDVDSLYTKKEELLHKMNTKEASKKEIDLFTTIEACYEMASRGYKISNIDLNRSLAKEFIINPDNQKEIIPPFIVIDGLGENVGDSIVKARSERPFMSKEDLMARTQLSQTLVKKLDSMNVLKGLDETNQVSLF